MIATEEIEAGTKIQEEEPVIVVRVPSSVIEAKIRLKEEYDDNWNNEDPEVFRNKVCGVLVEKALKNLDPTRKALYTNMFDKNDPKTNLGIFLTNALPLGTYSLMGVFPIINRINHSCLPNCQVHWNPDTLKEELFVTSQCEANSEVSISYMDMFTQNPTKQGRQEYLKHHFDFSCTCVLCSLSGEELEKDDQIRLEVQHAAEQLQLLKEDNTDNQDSFLSLLQHIYTCFSSRTFSLSSQWVFYVSGFHLNYRMGNMEEAAKCLETAIRMVELCKGSNSKDFLNLEQHRKLFKDKFIK